LLESFNEEEVGEGTFGDDAEFARVGIAGAGEVEEFGVS
jgi:hypothetical protein